MSRMTSRVTCRGTRTRGGGKVVDDERRDESRDEPRDMPRHLDARPSRSSRQRAVWRAARRAEAPRRTAEVK
jgi:hypothetical protein